MLKKKKREPSASPRQSNVLDICRWQIIETCGHKNHFFSRCFNVFFFSAADADVSVATHIQRSRLVTFPVLLARFPLTSSPPTKSFALLKSHFLMSLSHALSLLPFYHAPYIDATHPLCVRVYCNKKTLFRWPLSLSIFLYFFFISVWYLLHCVRFVSHFAMPFSHHSIHLVTNYKLFKFNFFTCSSTQNDIFLMLLSFPWRRSEATVPHSCSC